MFFTKDILDEGVNSIENTHFSQLDFQKETFRIPQANKMYGMLCWYDYIETTILLFILLSTIKNILFMNLYLYLL